MLLYILIYDVPCVHVELLQRENLEEKSFLIILNPEILLVEVFLKDKECNK